MALIRMLAKFRGASLTGTLSKIEADVRGMSLDTCADLLSAAGAERQVLAAAAEMKRLSAQIDVTIHALGILLCLPHILQPGEVVEYVSLGAGNTGRAFDLETNLRVAEFKFINWQGGPESVRQNGVFKDFYLLAESPGPKQRYLYLVGTDQALKFLNGGRALSSVLSRNEKLRKRFTEQFGDRFSVVREYYDAYRDVVAIQDVSEWLGELVPDLLLAETERDGG